MLRTVQLFSVVELRKRFKYGGLLLGVAVRLICHGFQLMEGQKGVNIIVRI